MANSIIKFLRGLNVIKTIGASDNIDADDLYGEDKIGIYYIKDFIPNVPARYSYLIVLSHSATSGEQILLASEMYFRGRWGNPIAWGAWRKVTKTDVTS